MTKLTKLIIHSIIHSIITNGWYAIMTKLTKLIIHSIIIKWIYLWAVDHIGGLPLNRILKNSKNTIELSVQVFVNFYRRMIIA